MDKFGCVLEIMFGNILFGEQVGGHIVQKEQLQELTKLGLQCYVNQQSEQAVKYFKQALKVCPRADIYNDLGLVYLNDGDYAKAINAFKSALGVDDSYLPAFYNLGVTFYYAKAYDIAVDIFDQVIKSSDGLEKDIILSTYNDKACAQNRKGDTQEALKTMAEGMAIDDKYVKFHANLGNINCSKGNFAEAKVEYDKALELDQKCASAYNGLGVIEIENGNFEKAKELFEKAIKLDSSCAAAEINFRNLKSIQERKKLGEKTEISSSDAL